MKDAPALVRESTFRITSSDSGNARFGTGFVLGRSVSGVYIVTCAHVVRDIGGESRVVVGGAPARLVAYGSPEGPDDLAVLEADVSPKATPLGLGSEAAAGRACTVVGFRELPGIQGLYVNSQLPGHLGSSIRLERKSRTVVAWDLKMSQPLPPGFSGSPVVDTATSDVLGVATIGFTDSAEAVALDLDVLRDLWPDGPVGRRTRLVHRGLEFVYVPGGEFEMGTPKRLADALATEHARVEFADEAPRTKVHVEGFYLCRTAISNAQYKQFVDDAGAPVPFRADTLSAPFSWDPHTRTYPKALADHPVVLVSWHEAVRYCEWLGGARLPTEAEWEKGARGIDGREWPWGGQWIAARCNTAEEGQNTVSENGRFSPAGDSPYGAADMAGNVWEWCATVYLPYPYDPGDGREEPAAVGPRVLRGGAWVHDRHLARCATRNHAQPGDFGFTIGFRAALMRQVPRL